MALVVGGNLENFAFFINDDPDPTRQGFTGLQAHLGIERDQIGLRIGPG